MHIVENIYGYLPEELVEIIIANSGAKYRAKQLFSGLHAGKNLDNINIDGPLRKILSEKYCTEPIANILTRKSIDGTEKFLLKLIDDNLIECVLMRKRYGNTLCVSTQVGCRMQCAFCASGKKGLIRNLTAGELVAQVIDINNRIEGNSARSIRNIVLMGSGEPLDNYDNVIKFLRIINHKDGINISPRNISLSTCGVVPGIIKLAEEGLPVTLSLSMHSAFEDKRQEIMPINKAYPLMQVIDALKHYFNKTGRRVIIEYSMIGGVNHSDQDAAQLAKVLSGLNCHVNLIKLSPIEDSAFKPCTPMQEQRFLTKLLELGLSATVRTQLGADIEGACGQLRNKFVGLKISENEPK